MIDNYRSLLKNAVRIYKTHEAGRKEPFNIFTVLRKASDEVNLHSRFLHALLNHQSPDTRRKNLENFLQRVGIKGFKQDGAKIKREYRYIDILISDKAKKQAVVIENKIEHKHEKEYEQLQKYNDTLTREGYSKINLLFLTLNGRKPSGDSISGLCYKKISYKEYILPWLKYCQMHAYAEPELRESIAQYIHLIRKLTGTDFDEAYKKELKALLSGFQFPADMCQDGAYMNDLTNLLSKDNNFVLAQDLTKNISKDDNPGLAHLNEAVTRTKISLLWKLWCEIESALKDIQEQIPDFPDKSTPSNISEDEVKKYVRKTLGHKKLCLYYQIIAQVHLVVRLDRSESGYNIYFGVSCDRTKYPTKYSKLQDALNALNGRSEGGFPWYKYPDEDINFNDLNRKTLKLLSKKEEREQFADGMADGLKEVWWRSSSVPKLRGKKKKKFLYEMKSREWFSQVISACQMRALFKADNNDLRVFTKQKVNKLTDAITRIECYSHIYTQYLIRLMAEGLLPQKKIVGILISFFTRLMMTMSWLLMTKSGSPSRIPQVLHIGYASTDAIKPHILKIGIVQKRMLQGIASCAMPQSIAK